MNKYIVYISFETMEDSDFYLDQVVSVMADTKEQALALLEPQVNKAWVTLKQQLLAGVVENPDEQYGIELK